MIDTSEDNHNNSSKYKMRNNATQNCLFYQKGTVIQKNNKVEDKICRSAEELKGIYPFEEIKKRGFTSIEDSFHFDNEEKFIELVKKSTPDFLKKKLKRAEIVEEYISSIKNIPSYLTSLTYINAQRDIETNKEKYAKDIKSFSRKTTI